MSYLDEIMESVKGWLNNRITDPAPKPPMADDDYLEWMKSWNIKFAFTNLKQLIKYDFLDDFIGENDKPDIEEDDLVADWRRTCDTIVAGIDERQPCKCDIRNQLRAELLKKAKLL